jgi:hypothetical protein
VACSGGVGAFAPNVRWSLVSVGEFLRVSSANEMPKKKQQQQQKKWKKWEKQTRERKKQT